MASTCPGTHDDASLGRHEDTFTHTERPATPQMELETAQPSFLVAAALSNAALDLRATW
jgi:hypothetical protein